MSIDTDRVFQDWVATINRELGTGFELDDENRLSLELLSGYRVGVECCSRAETYVIFAPVRELSSIGDLATMAAALQLNLFQRETAGGVIGLDSATGTLVYSFTGRINAGSPDRLIRQIDQFVCELERIQTCLENSSHNQRERLKTPVQIGNVAECPENGNSSTKTRLASRLAHASN